MTLIDLLSQMRAGGLFPIQVESIPELRDDLVFIGSLSEFIEAAKAVRLQFALLSSVTLSEDHFLWDNPDSDDEGEEEAEERIDLCRLIPELRKFKGRIGEDGHFDLSVPMPRGNLTLAIVEDWMEAFVELHSQAQQLLRDSSQEKRAQLEAAEDARTQHLLNNLRGLISDPEFVRLPTQRAMLAYAIEDFPELETLDERDLKIEIQNLKARIDAKGLRRK